MMNRKQEHSHDWIAYAWGRDLLKEELFQAQEHLKVCPGCRQEVRSLQELRKQLSHYRAELPSADFIPETMDLLEKKGILKETTTAEGRFWPGLGAWFGSQLMTRAPLVIATVLFTMLLQWMYWDPISGTKEIHTVFAFSEAPPTVLPSRGQLRLEAHRDGRFSGSLFQGRLNPSRIASLLKAQGMQFDVLILWAPEAQPVQIDLEELSPLMESFDLSALKLTGGVQGLLHRGSEEDLEGVELSARTPFWKGLGDWLPSLGRLGTASALDPPVLQTPAQIFMYVQADRIVVDRAVLSPEDLESVLLNLRETYPNTGFVFLEGSKSDELQGLEWRSRLEALGIPFSVLKLKP